jgi:RNA polymerase sigma-70 factor (ECF subfamily)
MRTDEGGSVSDRDLAEEFERLRPYLRRVAYSTLGSVAEADDVVQEAWLRLSRADASEIRDLRAWLSTVVGRLALDALGSARARRERYVGEWLPEPIVEEDPVDRVTLDERVTTALLVVLERLSPAERTSFVLHDVFGMEFGEVAEIVGRSPAAVRQLASRARRHVSDGTPRFPATRDEHERIVRAFATAWQAGDVAALLEVLDPAVTFRSDGGGRVVALREPAVGAEAVAEILAGFARITKRHGIDVRAAILDVNGLPGLVADDGETLTVMSFAIDAGRIVGLYAVRNPEKLGGVPRPSGYPDLR